MGILPRYVFREFVVPLGYCLAGFVSIYILFELFGSFSRMADAHIPAAMAARYFAGYLSPFFHYLAPAALMLAALYTMWSLGRRSELVAMRAGGVGLVTVLSPMMLVAAAMAVFTWWVDESYMPQTAEWAKRLRMERFDAVKAERGDGFSFCNTRDRRTWTVEAALDCGNSRLSGVRVSCDRPDGSRQISIESPEAVYLDGEWWFRDAKTRHYDAKGRQIASPVPELDALPLRCFPQFDETPEEISMQNSDAKYASVAGKFRYMRSNADLSDEARDALRYDAFSQALAPIACIVITLLSIPAGMTTGRQAVFSGVIGAVSMFFAYYGLVIGCMVMAKTSLMEPLAAALLPPVAFAVLGVFNCFKPTKATLTLLAIFMTLVAAYAILASVLETRFSIDRTMSRSLAATVPLLAAAAATAGLWRVPGRV